MNMKTIIVSVFLSLVMFTSCKKELEPQASSEVPATEMAVDGTTPPATQNIEQQFEVQNPNAQAPNPVQTQAAATTAPGMNPPHGQPNHRCDIAVGAPLNSPAGATPPAATQQPIPQGKASVQQVDMTSGTTATPPGMNPPHGQEGHRCEIAVGAPLPK